MAAASAKFIGGKFIEAVPLTPLGQLQMILGVAYLDGRPFSLVAFLQGLAAQFDVARPDADFAVGQLT